MLDVIFIDKAPEKAAAIALLLNEGLKMSSFLMLLDQEYQGIISKTLQDKQIFAGKFGQLKLLTTTNKRGEIRQLLLVGTGEESKLADTCIEELGGRIVAAAHAARVGNIAVNLESKLGNRLPAVAACLVASGALLASYKFDKYQTKQKEEEKFLVKSIEILTDDVPATQQSFVAKQAVIQGVWLARDYVSEPPNILYPHTYAEKIIKKFEDLPLEVEVLGEREMKMLGMGALLGVGQGSKNESKMVIMKYQGAGKDEDFIALVGKGVTFDTGGISLKPSLNLADMKYDMAGSAAVVGCMQAMALQKAKVNVVGVIGLVENMPGGNAQRPGDIVTTMSGQTVEVLDTDAEGRLVLADAIWYVQDKFKLKCVVNLATLTGAIVVSLGNSYAGLFANNDELAEKLLAASNKVNEKLWRMPLHKDFDEMIKSDVADIANIGNARGAAGSSTAAHFIQRFIKEGMPWAHLDIAGMAWEKKGKATCPKGATGYGVRLLVQFICDNYEG